MPVKTPFSGLARHLVLDGLLDEATAQSCLEKAFTNKIPFVIYLVQNKIVNPLELAISASQDFGVPLFDLSAYDKEHIPTKVINEQMVRRHHALPLFKRGEHLFVAISDPSNQTALDEIKFHTGLVTHSILVEENKLALLIEEHLAAEEKIALGDLTDTSLDELVISSGEESAGETATESETDDAPIVRFVHKILLDAINKQASDIHFEPYEKFYRIRFRIDGILYEMASPPVTLANRISSRLKVMSQLDISERRIPQDGRFKLTLSKKRSIDFRISTCPTVNGEKVVMRILDPSSATLGIDALGYEMEQKKQFLEAIHRPQGMILVTGPTGSGKTVSLYTALSILNTPKVNISTVEDPVEIHLQGVNQVNINLKTGLTFASALRSFLRQDPDIIMVGEMRDLETAEIGIKAAQTGHLVLSTLHTNSAAETLTRLANMGVPPYNIATSVTLIIAQRLARHLCDGCKRPVKIPPDELIKEGFAEAEIANLVIYGPIGCEKCINGYKGRTGLYETLKLSEAIGQIIMGGGNSLDIAKQARQEGMISLRESGLKKVRDGATSLEEVNRVTTD